MGHMGNLSMLLERGESKASSEQDSDTRVEKSAGKQSCTANDIRRDLMTGTITKRPVSLHNIYAELINDGDDDDDDDDDECHGDHIDTASDEQDNIDMTTI